jgi:hypothetical protein
MISVGKWIICFIYFLDSNVVREEVYDDISVNIL